MIHVGLLTDMFLFRLSYVVTDTVNSCMQQCCHVMQILFVHRISLTLELTIIIIIVNPRSTEIYYGFPIQTCVLHNLLISVN